jgi:hypothetical protein
MWSYEQRVLLDREHKLLLLIYGALLMSVLIYGGLAAMMPQSKSTSMVIAAADVQWKVFYGIGALLVFTIFIIRRRFLPRLAESGSAEMKITPILLKNRLGHLIIWVCSEAVGLLGLLIFFVMGRRGEALKFVGMSLLLMLIFYPRRIQ